MTTHKKTAKITSLIWSKPKSIAIQLSFKDSLGGIKWLATNSKMCSIWTSVDLNESKNQAHNI